MRIDLSIKSPETQQAERPSQSGNRVDLKKAARSAVGEDKAHLSLDQARIRELEAKVNALPEVRTERVKALRQRLEEGSYDVKPQQTAEAMMSELLDRSPLR